jgi:hypothetical protein
MSFTEYLGKALVFVAVAWLVIVVVAVVLVSLFPALGRDWGLSSRRFGR